MKAYIQQKEAPCSTRSTYYMNSARSVSAYQGSNNVISSKVMFTVPKGQTLGPIANPELSRYLKPIAVLPQQRRTVSVRQAVPIVLAQPKQIFGRETVDAQNVKNNLVYENNRLEQENRRIEIANNELLELIRRVKEQTHLERQERKTAQGSSLRRLYQSYMCEKGCQHQAQYKKMLLISSPVLHLL